MKKLLLISAALLLLLSAGCAKQANGPAAPESMTLETVSEGQAEVTLALQEETAAAEPGAENTAQAGETPFAPSQSDPAAAKGETAAAGSTDAAAPSNAATAKSAETTVKPNETTAISAGTTAKPNETTGISDGTPTKPSETTANQNGSQQTLPNAGDASAEKTTRSSNSETLPTADSGKDRFELPAIPLN